MKNIKKLSFILLTFSIFLTSCKGYKNDVKKTDNSDKKNTFVEKKTEYVEDTTTEVLVDKELKKEDIVNYYQHGDHWHVFTKDGREHITYINPENLKSGESSALVSVVNKEQLREIDVVSIKKHGDHYHVYTSDGREFLTYENPSSLYPNIKIEQYHGSHGQSRQFTKEEIKQKLDTDNGKSDDVIKILKHDDHYHIYTKSGKEFIAFEDPSSLYPHIKVEKYSGSHTGPKIEKDNIGLKKDDANTKKKESEKDSSKTINSDNSANQLVNKPEKESLSIVNILGKKGADIDNIVRILKHDNHYHLYDVNGNESITYENPGKYYPNIVIGEYSGNHGDSKDNKVNQNSENLNVDNSINSHNSTSSTNIEWPLGITKIIDHKDHWHLYINDREVAIVQIDPRPHYPGVEIIEEEGENTKDIVLNENEIFTYDSIEPMFIKELIPILSVNLKSMTNYGSLENTNIPIFGSEGAKENIFYWLHNDHYHAITIEQIIKKQKNNEFRQYSAKQVVAMLKYIIENPGTDLEIKSEVDFDEIKEFLLNHYKLTGSTDIMYIYGNIDIHKNGQTKTLSMADFKKVDGKIVPGVDLPVFEELKDVENNDNEDSSQNSNTSNDNLQNENANTENENANTNLDTKTQDLENNSQNISNNGKDKVLKEKENIEKIANYLNISAEDAFDVIYEIIDDNFSIIDLDIDNDGNVMLKGKHYKLKLPAQE